MDLIVMLAVSCAFIAVFSRSIKERALIWYGMALALDFAYAYGVVFSLPPWALHILSLTVQRATLATALFIIVMYCGVLPGQSAPRRRLSSIRGELSVMACILALAHCFNYLDSYVGVLVRDAEAVDALQLASLLLAFVLLVLLVMLGMTSLKRVKRSMPPAKWMAIQRLSYVFFAMIYVHEMLFLCPAAAKGSADALVTCVMSSVIFIGYAVLRIFRSIADARAVATDA